MRIIKLFAIFIGYFFVSSCTQSDGLAPSITLSLVPGAPAGVSATAGDSLVTVNWQAGSGSSGASYTVYRSLLSGTGYIALADCSNLSVFTCSDDTAVNGTTYYYVIRATNTFGTSTNSSEVSATPTAANSPPGSFTYTNSAPAYTLNVAITNNSPNVTGGGPISSWSISPNLATNTGLSFNTSTGVISGTPTILSNPGVSYTVTATNSNGTSQTNILISVTSGVAAPTISYSGIYTYQAGQTLTAPITPTLGGGAPTSCTSSPPLPTGFILNSTTCVISGTPTASAAQQNYTITATNSGGSGSGTVNIGVTSGTPNNISLTGVASFTTSSCALFNLNVRDLYGNPSNISADTTFTLSGAGTNGTFYSNATCSTASTSAVVASGSPGVSFYYRQTTPGSATLVATLTSPATPALGSASRNITVAISTPAKIGLAAPATGTTISCNAVNVNILDASDNSVNATSSVTVNLSGSSSSFFSNSTCATGASSVVIPAGSNTATMYMRRTSVGTATLTGSATGMASGSTSINITLAPAERIIFSAVPSVPYPISSCQAYTLQTRDSLNNNASNVITDTNVALSGVSDGAFYSSSTCAAGSEITSTVITAGTSSRIIYYSKPTTTAIVPGSNITLTASVVGWTPNATASVSVSSGGPFTLNTTNGAVGIAVSTSTQVTTANKCLGTTIRAVDETGLLVPTSRVTTAITSNLSGGGSGAQFWSNSSCTTSTSTVTIPVNNNTATFYYSSTAETAAVNITWSNGGLTGTGGSRSVTVTSGTPTRLTWTAAPSSYNVNTCQTYSFYTRDPNNVTAIGANVLTATDFQLSDGSDGIFYSNSSCTTPITTVQVAAGAQSATFYYRKLNPSTATISVTLQNPLSPAIATLTQAINVTSPALTANNVLLTANPSTSLVATQSCSLLTLQSRNNTTVVNVTSNTTFTLSVTNGAGFFYDSGCTAAASPLTMTIAANTSSVSGLYVRSPNSGNATISGTGSLTFNGVTLSYSAPPPTMLDLTGPIFLFQGTTCGVFNIKTQDSAGFDRNVTSNTTVNVASTGTVPLQFFSDSSCSTALPSNQVTINTGASSATFYAKGSTVGAASAQVTSTGLTSSSHSLNVNAP
jgi:hypothetical protein